jgi:uncharacterized beta-barrel protein YwiB (DUF1934 family)
MENWSRHVLIRLTSLQRDEEGKEETISLETPGISGMKDGIPYVRYDETELVGMEGTTTTLWFYDDKVILERTGSFMQRQEYRPQEETTSDYETPAGTLRLHVKTRELNVRLTEGLGTVHIVYELVMEGLFDHVNEISIEVREDPDFYGSKRSAERSH